MLNPRAVAATAIVIVAAGCSQNASVPAVAPSTTAPAAVPTATPAGATPTATPGVAAVVPAPSAVTLTGLGASYAQGLNVAQPGYAGSFSQTNTCAGVASVAPIAVQSASPTFTITPIATGTCSITITGGSSQSVIVPVTVTTSGLVVSGRRNHS
jgi:hypothetical protein